MSLKDPENVYLILLEEITGIKNVGKSTACIILSICQSIIFNFNFLKKIDDLFRTNKIPNHYNKQANEVYNGTKFVI